MKAFQCSQCANLQLNENEKCSCHAAMPDPRWRDKSDKQSCLDAFKPLPPERRNMQEAFENIIDKLEEIRIKKTCKKEKCDTKELCRICVVDDAIEIVKQEAEKYNNGWIMCSERLPKYGEVVMCCCENGGITVSCITHKCVKLSKFVWFGQHRVIAWQPLPAPYQPKGE